MTLAPRPTQMLRVLLHTRRTATLGTQSLRTDEAPGLALVPYAIDGQGGCLVLLLSSSSAHARQMLAHTEVSLLVAQSDVSQQAVHVHERVAIVGHARMPTPGSAAWGSARYAYLRRFPEAAAMAKLGDFRIVCIVPQQARHVAGYGAARDVDQTELHALLASAH